jgi:hypothetical protein
MQYEGRLYGKVGKKYIPLTTPASAYDAMKTTLEKVESWLVCAAIASPEDMAQSIPEMLELVSNTLRERIEKKT